MGRKCANEHLLCSRKPVFSTTLLVVGSVAHEATAFLDVSPTIAPTPTSPEQRNSLLAALISMEDNTCQLVYAALCVHALTCDDHTLSLRETQLVIAYGMTIGGHSLGEHLEAVNHAMAYTYLYAHTCG